MTIDARRALRATVPVPPFAWSPADVELYHLALGAGSDPTHPRELGYASDPVRVLPTFAIVAPFLHVPFGPRPRPPGLEIELAGVLHVGQQLELHEPIATAGDASGVSRVVEIADKGTAAVVTTETRVTDPADRPLWTTRSTIFARGAGGFGGERGTSSRAIDPDGRPDAQITVATLPQQALWYRLLGDRNPLHSDPATAAAAGYPRPILHGLATLGLAVKAVVDEVLGGDTGAVRRLGARFAGAVYPGETLRVRVWRGAGEQRFSVDVPSRDDATVLSGGTLEHV